MKIYAKERRKLPVKLHHRNVGSNNGHWKGEEVGYSALHEWIRRRLKKPRKCTRCNVKKDLLDLANKSGEYKRDLTDWEYLCRKCHMATDGRSDYLRNYGKSLRLKDKNCSNKNCVMLFHPKKNSTKYCSRKCYTDTNKNSY